MLSIVSLSVGSAAIAVIGCAALQDVRERLIANRYSLILLLLAVAHHACRADSFVGWLEASGGALMVATALFVPGFLLWRAGGLGGGDVKLLVAAGCFVGVDGIAVLLVGTALTGGVLAPAYVLLPKLSPLVAWRFAGPAALRTDDRPRSLPYGVAIATGFAGAVVPSLAMLIG